MRIIGLVIGAMFAVLVAAAGAGAAQSGESVPLSVYGRLPTVQNLALSPSGKLMMAQVSDNGTATLQIRDAETLKTIRKIALPASKLRRLQWADDTHILLTYSVAQLVNGLSDPKREWFLASEFDLETGKVRYLLANNRDGLNSLAAWPVVYAHPKTGYALLLYGITFPANRGVLTLILERKGLSKVVAVGNEDTTDYAIAKDGAILGRIDYDRVRGNWNVLVGPDHFHIKSSQKGSDLLNPPVFAGVSADSQTVYVAKSDGDTGHIYPIDVASATWGEPIKDLEDHGLISAPNDQVVIAAQKSDLEGTHYRFFDAKDEGLWRGIVKAFKGAQVDFQSVSDDRMKFIVLVDGADFGYGYFLVDRKTGAAKWLYDAYSGLGPDQIAPVSLIHYKAADGFDIPAYLTLPKVGAKNLPLIVLPHGGPFARDYAGFDWWSQAYASLGYAVLQPQFRGSDGLGVDHLKAGYGEYGRKMQTDLSDGVADLAKQGVIDPARVAIVGASYGGYAALAGVTLQSGIFRCAVSVAGPADMRRQLDYFKLQNHGPWTPATRYWREYLDIKKESDPILEVISPVFHADKASVPILLIHGSDDTVVPPEQSRRMADALKRAGKSVELLEMKGEDHWLSVADTRQQMLTRSAQFLGQCNPAG